MAREGPPVLRGPRWPYVVSPTAIIIVYVYTVYSIHTTGCSYRDGCCAPTFNTGVSFVVYIYAGRSNRPVASNRHWPSYRTCHVGKTAQGKGGKWRTLFVNIDPTAMGASSCPDAPLGYAVTSCCGALCQTRQSACRLGPQAVGCGGKGDVCGCDLVCRFFITLSLIISMSLSRGLLIRLRARRENHQWRLRKMLISADPVVLSRFEPISFLVVVYLVAS